MISAAKFEKFYARNFSRKTRLRSYKIIDSSVKILAVHVIYINSTLKLKMLKMINKLRD